MNKLQNNPQSLEVKSLIKVTLESVDELKGEILSLNESIYKDFEKAQEALIESGKAIISDYREKTNCKSLNPFPELERIEFHTLDYYYGTELRDTLLHMPDVEILREYMRALSLVKRGGVEEGLIQNYVYGIFEFLAYSYLLNATNTTYREDIAINNIMRLTYNDFEENPYAKAEGLSKIKSYWDWLCETTVDRNLIPKRQKSWQESEAFIERIGDLAKVDEFIDMLVYALELQGYNVSLY